VSVHNGVLDIKAESREESETKEEKFFRRERTVTSLSRRIALPGNPTADDVAAEMKDGVLKVKIAPSAKNVPRRVEIK
jgi:HSP20 family protein